MRYFRTKIISRNDKNTTLKLLNSLIFKKTDEFFIFPFCFFMKSYYLHLRERKNKPFIGNINGNDIEFHKTIYYGNSNGQTIRNLKILGKIIEKENKSIIELEFHSTTFETILETIIFIGLLLCFIVYRQPLLLIIPLYLLIEKTRITMVNFLKIKRRINKNIDDI